MQAVSFDSVASTGLKMLVKECFKTTDAQAVSVVIATLGGSTLLSTIADLNSGTVVPAENLVCIPELEARD